MRTLNKNMGQNGAAAVEFAIVLPLLVLLVFGIIEFSILFYNKAMITNSSREGARAGIVLVPGQTYADVKATVTSVVNAYCSNYLITFGGGGPNPTNIDAYPAPPKVLSSEPEAGDSLTVRVDYHYDFLVLPNFVGSLMGGADLTGLTVMRME